ncbi:MAG: hypothetical protein ACRD3K_00510 [Edaphobacter sp.]
MIQRLKASYIAAILIATLSAIPAPPSPQPRPHHPAHLTKPFAQFQQQHQRRSHTGLGRSPGSSEVVVEPAKAKMARKQVPQPNTSTKGADYTA